MVNTEKPIAKAEQKRQGVVKTPKEKKTVNKLMDNQSAKNEAKESKTPSSEEEKKKDSSEKQVPKQNKPKTKKTDACVNAVSFPISTKYSIAICKFIKRKKIEKAIADLQQVILKKKAVPMKGEIPHRKGKGMMSGRFPKKASEYFIKLLKSLSANATANELENPVIVEAVPNIASRPFGRFGRVRRKRTHIKIRVIEKSALNKKQKEKEK